MTIVGACRSILRLKHLARAAIILAAGLAAATQPAQAQTPTVLRGSPPSAARSVDCSNPSYSRYCADDAARLNPSYPAYGYDPSDAADGYGDAYPYYGSGLPVGVGVGRGFVRHRVFRGGVVHGGFRGGFRGGFGHR
jgi:hypothetical protein